jgi:glycosyltransferase involved in cell wall biosynthesis
MSAARHRLCQTSKAYRKSFVEAASEPVSDAYKLDDLPCVLRGLPIRMDRCRLAQCVGGPDVQVYGCDLHGECTLNQHAIPGVKVCRKCSGRMAEPPPKPGPIRVVFFSPGMLRGGAERWILSLAKHWKPADVVCTGIVIADGTGSEPELCEEARRLGVTVYGTERQASGFANADIDRSATMTEAATKALHNADVVISWGWADVGDVLSLAGWSGPHVLVSHGACDWSSARLERACETATHLAAVSEAAAGSFPATQRDRVKVLWNGIEVDRVVATRDRDAVRASWGCRREMLVGYLGRHSKEKRCEAVALAVSELRRRGINAKGVWIGNGWQTELVKRTCEGIAPGACVWVDPPDHVGDALAALDCLVLASPSEGMSLALCEAWAAGVPTVATPVGAVPELHCDFGTLCEVVPVGADAVQLADAVMRATGAGNLRRVAYAREVTLREFSAARMGRRWADWLGEIQRNTITASVRGSIATRTP